MVADKGFVLIDGKGEESESCEFKHLKGGCYAPLYGDVRRRRRSAMMVNSTPSGRGVVGYTHAVQAHVCS